MNRKFIKLALIAVILTLGFVIAKNNDIRAAKVLNEIKNKFHLIIINK